jgi:hypothetical protein
MMRDVRVGNSWCGGARMAPQEGALLLLRLRLLLLLLLLLRAHAAELRVITGGRAER